MPDPEILATVRKRLAGCFQAVFPTLSEAQIHNAKQSEISDWDSLAALKLATLIEEEFGIELDFEQAAELETFQALADYLSGLE